MSFLFNILQVLVAVIAVVVAYFLWSFQYWKRRNIPYLEPTLPFGNLENPLRRTMSPGEQVLDFYNTTKSRGLRYVGVYNITFPALVIRDLELTKLIMSKDFNYFTDRGNYVNEKTDPLSAHLFSLGGTKWRDLRRKLTPTFTTAKMRHMFQTLLDCGLVLEKYLQTQIMEEKPIEIKSVVANFTTDVIGSCAFGIECNSFKEPDSPFRVNSTKLFHPTLSDILRGLFTENAQTISNALGIRMTNKDVSDFFLKLVNDTVNYRQQTEVKRNDFLQLLIDIMDKDKKAKKEDKGDNLHLTVNDIAAQSFLFFLAGHETSATTTSFALFELAQHPDMQNRLRGEITTVLEKHDNKVTYDGIYEMTYMGQVIDETLRIYPPAPFVTRLCMDDWKIPDCDYVIQKDTRVIFSIMGIHHDSNYFENPEKFDPERFTEENKKNRHPFAHIPFGEGPRICIGLRFGIMQTKVGLTTILRNYRVTLSDKTKLPLKFSTNAFVLSVEGGLWLNFERINR